MILYVFWMTLFDCRLLGMEWWNKEIHISISMFWVFQCKTWENAENWPKSLRGASPASNNKIIAIEKDKVLRRNLEILSNRPLLVWHHSPLRRQILTLWRRLNFRLFTLSTEIFYRLQRLFTEINQARRIHVNQIQAVLGLHTWIASRKGRKGH